MPHTSAHVACSMHSRSDTSRAAYNATPRRRGGNGGVHLCINYLRRASPSAACTTRQPSPMRGMRRTHAHNPAAMRHTPPRTGASRAVAQMAETPMNPVSSRSHCVFTVHISSRASGDRVYRHAKLNLVDLAGASLPPLCSAPRFSRHCEYSLVLSVGDLLLHCRLGARRPDARRGAAAARGEVHQPVAALPAAGGPTPATSAPGLGSPPPHLHRDWAHPRHICTGTAPKRTSPRKSWLGWLHSLGTAPRRVWRALDPRHGVGRRGRKYGARRCTAAGGRVRRRGGRR